MKYIDAEKLIELIDAKLEDLGMSGSVWVGRSVLNELKDDIESLQQEQPDVDLEKEVKRYFMDSGYELSSYECYSIARHFYELGKNARKDDN